MADGSLDGRAGPKQINCTTFFASETEHCDTKKYDGKTVDGDRVKLSFYTELEASECEKSYSRGVAAMPAAHSTGSRNSYKADAEGAERKKRCFDRYDSSESSDSGVAVLSPTESSVCDSDITEPRSPRSPESGCSTGSSGSSSSEGPRMPPWVSEPAPAPPPPRRLAAQPAPVRRTNPPLHRRITEFFNHKMKPQNGLKRESSTVGNDDTKRKCLPKNGVTNDLEKYISYLSQTLSPKVLLDVGKQAEANARKTNIQSARAHGANDGVKASDLSKTTPSSNIKGLMDFSRPKYNKEQVHTTMNGFVEVRHATESLTKEKTNRGPLNGLVDSKLQNCSYPSANGIVNTKHIPDFLKHKVPIPASKETGGIRIAPATSGSYSPKQLLPAKHDTSKMNGVVSSTTKLDSRMNGVTCGSNNLSLNTISCKSSAAKKDAPKKSTQPSKRTNRKSSACIANSKNLTWSKANNLKQQVQLKKQCANVIQGLPVQNVPGEANPAPKMNIPNGVRHVSNFNGSLGNLNVPVTNFQNCHQINIPQPCGTVSSTNLQSFVAVPQNMMLTALRIPQNGISAQTINQQNNMTSYNRQNVNVSSPTKLNGQFVFPLMQNLNGAVVQIPNLMAKMPNFVIPQSAQLQQRQDHLHNQQAAQILINGTLLKLANTMTPTYPNMNKPTTSQSIPVMNKNVPGMPNVGMTMHPKPNYAVNLSHSMYMPQPGFIVTSVPNLNVKETWSYTHTNSLSTAQTSCSNNVVHHPQPIVSNYTTQTLHTTSIPIVPAKPPDNPIQGTDPPSSTVQEPEISEATSLKCDIPWLSKTVNNNIVPLDSKLPSRPFARVSRLSEKLEELKSNVEDNMCISRNDNLNDELRKVEEVARREETIFTQITVLKDVSSNVQSSLIEANFCNATMESSESGIGTDKSIGSPSDSQTSKECDDDSSLSLSVSVCSVDVQSCQKSPILKQPKTLRFPPRSLVKSGGDKRKSSTDTSSGVTVCLWENCTGEFENDSDLLEHLTMTHVESQAGKENYVCLWARCKVRGKPSCSRLWLERHALSHGGNKPFKCIVDGCERRFSTQILLERHVNNHFSEASPNSNGAKKTTDSNGSKLIRRNGKKLRYRRQPWSARMFDFFDAGMMEGLSWRLARATRWRLGGACPLREPAGRHTVTLHATVAATRYNTATGGREALLTYYPPNVIEDEWVPEKEVISIKRVEISELPTATKVSMFEQFCSSYRSNPTPAPAQKTTSQSTPVRLLPARNCTSSRLLNNLLMKKKEARNDCSATNVPMVCVEENKAEVSGAKKRKMGRRQGGNAFWPCGR